MGILPTEGPRKDSGASDRILGSAKRIHGTATWAGYRQVSAAFGGSDLPYLLCRFAIGHPTPLQHLCRLLQT